MVLQNQADGHESKFIQKILKVVENKRSRPVLYICPHLIGTERRVEKINSWLEDGSTDVDTLVICGIGGIGKTTMAKKKKHVFSVDEGMIEMRDVVSCKRILLVLDDVDNRDQLDALLEMKDLLYPGKQATQTIQGIILDVEMRTENDIVNASFSAIDFKKHKTKNFLTIQILREKLRLLQFDQVTNELVLVTDVFANMQKLRLLQFDHVELQGSFDVFPKRLRWVRWSELQLECMPIDFPLESLVVIELQRRSLRKIWHGVKFLKYLKIFNLSHSYELLRTPDF
ncbi:hypothetical protein RND71_041204 [Anisodus tanguticus]|uniref:NB-ARC domain-containing protein n=1 Tax=Anisodus tanguticus TaxID=243964 RepID=A0AAE1UQY3_9SOLA|nr:hypothetical protein RND71_041204 [Anisodus tanguticus]